MAASDRADADFLRETLCIMFPLACVGLIKFATAIGVCTLLLVILRPIVCRWLARRAIRKAVHRDLGAIMDRKMIDEILDALEKRR